MNYAGPTATILDWTEHLGARYRIRQETPTSGFYWEVSTYDFLGRPAGVERSMGCFYTDMGGDYPPDALAAAVEAVKRYIAKRVAS